ncbi:MAG: hypothetical protein KGS61_14740 [Verrucomicrobia bacterium]|nr:hypothetical protein [Verrucomicrobiota bacterium]
MNRFLYAPEEFACDSSATIRVTAYLNRTAIDSNTTNAQAGTWPSETLRIHAAEGFNRVVVHYDAPPVTGGNWGPIFMAENMVVTPAQPPVLLQNPAVLAGGPLRFGFTNQAGSAFTVLSTTNPAAPVAAWAPLGLATEIAPGCYQFSDPDALNHPQRFYCVRLP